MKKIMICSGIIIVLLIGFCVYFILTRTGTEKYTYKTSSIQFGDFVTTISASGTVEPEELIDIGARVGGRIVSLGKDKNGKSVDYCSVVEEGTVLANIDDVLYQAAIKGGEASLSQANATLKKAEAVLNQLKAKLDLAENDYKRATTLRKANVNSKADFDSYKSAYEAALANVNVGISAVDQTKASVKMSEVDLEQAKLNLDYCTIKSPVKGVVIDRRVNIGQTVNASMSAPSLFLIARDLTRMEVWVTVNEADVGKIKPNQQVTFSVDTFPGKIFKGTVAKVRLNATVTSNVVTYVVVVSTDNSSGELLPYLTANVKFEVYRKDGVFMVNNSALRWSPKNAVSSNSSGKASDDRKTGTIWILNKNGAPEPVEVTVLASNDTATAVEGKGLEKDLKVIVGTQTIGDTASSENSPFLPKMKPPK